MKWATSVTSQRKQVRCCLGVEWGKGKNPDPSVTGWATDTCFQAKLCSPVSCNLFQQPASAGFPRHNRTLILDWQFPSCCLGMARSLTAASWLESKASSHNPLNQHCCYLPPGWALQRCWQMELLAPWYCTTPRGGNNLVYVCNCIVQRVPSQGSEQHQSRSKHKPTFLLLRSTYAAVYLSTMCPPRAPCWLISWLLPQFFSSFLLLSVLHTLSALYCHFSLSFLSLYLPLFLEPFYPLPYWTSPAGFEGTKGNGEDGELTMEAAMRKEAPSSSCFLQNLARRYSIKGNWCLSSHVIHCLNGYVYLTESIVH